MNGLWPKQLHEKPKSDKRQPDKRSLNGCSEVGEMISSATSTASALIWIVS